MNEITELINKGMAAQSAVDKLKLKPPTFEATTQHHGKDFTYSVRVWQDGPGLWKATIKDGNGTCLREGRKSDREAILSDVEREFRDLLWL